MYVNPNYKTKKELKYALSKNEYIEVYSPGLGTVPVNGEIYLEGPHYPREHMWYVIGIMKNGKLIKIIEDK